MNTRLRGLIGRVPRDRAATAAVAVILVAVVASVLAWPSGRMMTSPLPISTAVADATPTAAPSDNPGATPTEEPWEPLVLGPEVLVAAIAPDRDDRTGIATDSRFTLRSLSDTPAVELAAGVRSEPPIEFRVVPGATPDEVILEPTEPLFERQRYRFMLTAPDGSLGGSWAFRTQSPLNVEGTLPGDEATDVPVDTGIEVTFDQDGPIGFETHFSIEPAITGRFESYGRTWVFVPDRPLRPATAYRVTVTPGVGLSGSDQVLERGASFRFETAVAGATEEMAVDFAGPMFAVRPGVQPAVPLYADFYEDEEDSAPRPETLPVRIYRLPDLASTLAAAERLTGPNSWLRASGAGLVSIDGLVLVARLDAPLVIDREYAAILSIPVRLDPGAYVVVVPRQARTAQMLLQVRDLGVYALSTETDSVAWVNDLDEVTPIQGARVALPGGRVLGATDADGVARFATPAELMPELSKDWEVRPRLVSVTAPDGRWLVAALGSRISWLEGRYDSNVSAAERPSNRFWLLLETDRDEYRQTDTVHTWGVVKAREGEVAPRSVEVLLKASGDDDWEDGPLASVPILRVAVSPSARGVFTADIPLDGLPRASYSVVLLIDGVRASTRWISISDIRKPSYRLEVETDRHAYLDGDEISVSIQASFFDGSTVPAIDLRVESDAAGFDTVVTTDGSGGAHLTIPANFAYDEPAGWAGQSIYVTPARPEEGEITGGTDVIVFPSTAWPTADARLTNTTLVVEGRLTRVPFAAINASYVEGSWDWPDDVVATGRPITDREVSATVVQLKQVRGASHTEYDYIEKRVVTYYDYDIVERTVGTFTARTGSDGTYRITVAVPSATDSYDIRVRTTDADGRRVLTDAYAQPTIEPRAESRPPYFQSTICGWTPPVYVGVGDEADVTLHDGDGRVADDGRFLFVVANRGLREVALSEEATFRRTLRDADLPGFTVRAVQATSNGFAVADVDIRVDLDDLNVTVELTPDRARYGPGERATVSIRTLGPDGRPVAADVVVQGVDEKLFAIGAAHEVEILEDLHRATGHGFLQSVASHRMAVRLPDGGCGATGGGRDSFGDFVTFQMVRTGSDGRATAAFDLLDDLTSWRLTALAVTDGLRAGSSSVLLPVSLPFFVESVLAPEYLVDDVPVLRVRGYGDALRAGDAVRFTVSAPSLGLAATTVEGRAFEAVRVPLPAMTVGRHEIRIEGSGPGAGQADAVVRVVRVVPSRLSGLVTRYQMLTPGFSPGGGDGLSSYTVIDAGRGSMLPLLLELVDTSSARFDRAAAAEVARRLLIDEFGYDPESLPPTGFDASRYEHEGIALLPYSSTDRGLSALAALVVPELVRVDSLRDYLADRGTTRETGIIALAGQAGLGVDMLEELRAASAEPNLTIRESLWIAIGLQAAGDENGARAIERDLLERRGERFGPWVRLAVGGSIEDTVDAARLLLILSSRLGEPFAPDVARYIADHPAKERVIPLELLAYAQASLDRLPRAPGRFAWTVAGERHEVELEPGRSLTLVLTATQRATFQLEPLAGKLAVVSSWIGSSADLPQSPSVTLVRTVTPATNAPEDRLVRVSIQVTFGPLATRGCWQIVDLAPSGLVPVHRTSAWPDADFPSDVSSPYEIDGQRVAWCASPGSPAREFRYYARVVSPGSYAWEPAVIQAVDAPELGAVTDAFRFTIR